MSITINREQCTGCGKCLKVCPGSLIYKDEFGKSYIKYPKECWGCTSCLKECASGAIQFYLGADIGGRGGYMQTRKEKDLLHWTIHKAEGETVEITINLKDPNRY